MAVVKANAYGHGDVAVARAALDAGATWLGVALVEEGLALRAAGIEAPILVLSEFPAGAEDDGARRPAHARRVLGCRPRAALAAAGVGRPRSRPREGRHRDASGRGVAARGRGRVPRARRAGGLAIEGLWTHLAKSEDDEGRRRTSSTGSLRSSTDARRRRDHGPAAARGEQRRPDPAPRGDVRPRARRGSRSTASRPPPGSATSSGSGRRSPGARRSRSAKPARGGGRGSRTAIATSWNATPGSRPCRSATPTDTLAPRRRAARVLIRGRRCRVAGTVTMDQTMVDCGELEVAAGRRGRPAGPPGRRGGQRLRIWGAAGTIGYEIVTRIGDRVPRGYVGMKRRTAARLGRCRHRRGRGGRDRPDRLPAPPRHVTSRPRRSGSPPRGPRPRRSRSTERSSRCVRPAIPGHRDPARRHGFSLDMTHLAASSGSSCRARVPVRLMDHARPRPKRSAPRTAT